MNKYAKLVISVLIPLLVGFIGGFATSNSVSGWYVELNKPVFNPPNWIFGPVWTLLYIMMGVSLYLVWNSKAKVKEKKKVFWIFGIQLVLNLLWSLIFFGAHMIPFAFFEIILLWISIILNIIFAYKISKPAGYLLVPYLLWVSFASVLNFSLMILN